MLIAGLRREQTLRFHRNMAQGHYRFAQFSLDPVERQLKHGEQPVELNARYFDALMLLVREHGTLVSKERFLKEVWNGATVSDEALSQCIKTLRRQLGDNAAKPSFIATVPKHGYRFIAPVEWQEELTASAQTPLLTESSSPYSWPKLLMLGGAGMLGSGIAGVLGGLLFGFVSTAQPLQNGMGAISILLVMLAITTLVALVGGAGVAFGIAAAGFFGHQRWWQPTAGGALGGMLVGAVGKLLGVDAFHLLLGQSPGDITGAMEGTLLGAAVGFGYWLAVRVRQSRSIQRAVMFAVGIGGAIGLLIPLLGGRMMAGSLDLLARSFPDSQLRLNPFGALFGEQGLGTISQTIIGGIEGALFVGGMITAMMLAHRQLSNKERNAAE